VPLERHRDGGEPRVSLEAVLDELGRHEMTNVLVEGGGVVLGEFFDRGLADELHIYVAPLLVGGRAAPGPLQGAGAARIADAVRLPGAEVRRVGDGVRIRARTSP
jgi:diaminohydroxyphosphoribosylaminopyrimidine deaminase/5-amino-6-(5-phosphoribosylamino)uracil reductase